MTQEHISLIRDEIGILTGAERMPTKHVGGRRTEIEIVNVSKEFRSHSGTTVLALQDVSLSVWHREFVAVVGRSGCGKTTLLRILAGLSLPTQGYVLTAGGLLWRDGQRNNDTIGESAIVFQTPNLFPWFTTEENIALPLVVRGIDKTHRKTRVDELCRLVGLSGFERCYPRELSGGMCQRVAIARALCCQPSVLLMDEPFVALDALTRDKMNIELQALAAGTAATVVFVTHSIREAVLSADRVVLISPRPGRIRSITAVPFPRPRALDLEREPYFQDIVRELRSQLDEET